MAFLNDNEFLKSVNKNYNLQKQQQQQQSPSSPPLQQNEHYTSNSHLIAATQPTGRQASSKLNSSSQKLSKSINFTKPSTFYAGTSKHGEFNYYLASDYVSTNGGGGGGGSNKNLNTTTTNGSCNMFGGSNTNLNGSIYHSNASVHLTTANDNLENSNTKYDHYNSQQVLSNKQQQRGSSKQQQHYERASRPSRIKLPSSYLAMKKYFNAKLIENNLYNNLKNVNHNHHNYSSTSNLVDSTNNIYNWLNVSQNNIHNATKLHDSSLDLCANDSSYDQRSAYFKYADGYNYYAGGSNLRPYVATTEGSNIFEYDMCSGNVNMGGPVIPLPMNSYTSNDFSINDASTSMLNFYKSQNDKLNSARRQMCSRASSNYCNCYSPNDCSNSIIDSSTTSPQSNTNNNISATSSSHNNNSSSTSGPASNLKQMHYLNNKLSQNSLVNIKTGSSSSTSNKHQQQQLLSQQSRHQRVNPNRSLMFDEYDLSDFKNTDLLVESYSDMNSFNQANVRPELKQYK